MNNARAQLNGYQKILNAINGTPTETTPLALVLSLYGSKLTSSPPKEYYSNPEAYVKGQEAIVDLYNPDIITTPFVLPFEGEAFGSEIKYVAKMTPQLKRPVISSYDEIKNLKTPAYNEGAKAYCLECAKMLVSRYKYKNFILGFTLSCIDSCAMIMGVEGFMDTLLFHPKELQLLFEKTSRHFIEYSNALFDIGVDAIAIPSAFCSPTMVTSKIIEEVILDPLTNALQKIKGSVIIHNGSATNLKFLHYYVNLPNVAGFVIDNRENMDEARQIVGNKLLLGNMNIATIAEKTPEVVQRATSRILNRRKSDNHFVFCNAGPDVTYETPHENIIAICNTVNNFKKKHVKHKKICIACSIFKKELEALKKEGAINIPIIYLDSMLHMKPDKLNALLSAEIEKYNDYEIILAFGDCSTGMFDIENKHNVKRTKGLNCTNILLGTSEYRKLRKEGAFILFNEWVHRWKEVFIDEFGFKKSESATLFMNEMHTKFVYLDLGDAEIPHDTLKELSDFCGLPYEIKSSTSEFLAKSIFSLNQLFDYGR
ncbi:MAG: DUF1638 domain-containing protein [Bacteroidetes bacterium]|nr:DUF1638 domain-containing protein [Bacteroidota bacterium]